MHGSETDEDTSWVVLCTGCAAEAGLDDDAHAMQPDGEVDLACASCAAIIVGFSYRVPERAWGAGMSPGPG